MEERESFRIKQNRAERKRMAGKTVQSINAEAERRGDEMKIKSGIDRIEQRLRYQSRAVSHDYNAVTAETCSTRSSEVTRAPWLSSPCV